MDYSHDITTFGRRLLPHIIDERARHGYSQPFAMFPKSKHLVEGFRSVTYESISNAINQWWLESKLPEDDKESTFAYFGPNDLRYVIFFVASIKTRKKILIASPRNTIVAQLSLFKRASCNAIVSCSSLSQILKPLFIASEPIQKFESPDLNTLLEAAIVPHYNYHETFESVSEKNIGIFHTSGSSGNPKPITWNQRFLTALDTGNILPNDQGTSLTREFFHREYVLELLPCFHVGLISLASFIPEEPYLLLEQGGGLAVNTFPAFYEMILVLGHPEVPLSAQYVAELLKQDIITGMLSPPSILEDLAADPIAVQSLAKLNHVGYAGGPLQPAIGNKLSTKVPHFFSLIGATEYGWFHMISGGNHNWDSAHFFSGIGYRFEEVADGMFEMIILSDNRTNKYHGIFEVFPSLSEYRTKDLYSKNLEAPGWWKYRGRSDDLIVLSNGEKINPIPLENIIRSHPAVKSALVIGEYRFSPSLLVETETETQADGRELLDEIWPKVVEANKIAPGFSKISKSMILFAKPNKPFLRAGKGTVQRQLTVKAYQHELNRLYSLQENDLLIEGLTLNAPNSMESIEVFTREIFSQALERDDLKDSDDVFQNGMDSLRVILVVQRLRAAMKACGFQNNPEDINARLVYLASSVNKMTRTLLELVSKRTEGSYPNGDSSESREKLLEFLIKNYSSDTLSSPENGQITIHEKHLEPWSIVLTGTTGSLGSYLLAAFDAMPANRVAKIICLNRTSNAIEKQKKLDQARQRRATWHNGESNRVIFFQADLTKSNLGLAREVYDSLLQQATVIVHSAWQVDFNLTVESFGPHIRGIKNLLDLSYRSVKKAPLTFISSISTTLRWPEIHPGENIPEEIIFDFDAPEKIGYGESKFIGEHLLNRYSRSTGLPTTVLRIGQIAGPVHGKGIWNSREWFPSMMASSKHLGLLPNSLGQFDKIDWIPVDALADIVADLVCHTINDSVIGKTSVYNVVNPKISRWSKLINSVQEGMGIAKIVPLKDWVKALGESSRGNNGTLIETNPGVKLLDFFHLMSSFESSSEFPAYEVEKLLRSSDSASTITAVSPEWMSLWIRQWGL